jgi:hypothetical protein
VVYARGERLAGWSWLTLHFISSVLLCSIIRAIIALMMEAASTSKTSVNFYQTTWCNNPEDSQLHTRRRENLKSHLATLILLQLIFLGHLIQCFFFSVTSTYSTFITLHISTLSTIFKGYHTSIKGLQ